MVKNGVEDPREKKAEKGKEVREEIRQEGRQLESGKREQISELGRLKQNNGRTNEERKRRKNYNGGK